MTTTINASPSNGLVQTADGSGILKVQSNGVTTNALAWVRFDSSSGSSCTVNASYNVSSVTYNATGLYTVNFTNTLSDANYSVCGSCGVLPGAAAGSLGIADNSVLPSTSAVKVYSVSLANVLANYTRLSVAIFGN